MSLDVRLADARRRLADALVRGDDTRPHRAAVDRLARDGEAAAQRLREDEAKRAAAASSSVRSRAAAIAEQAAARVMATLDQFPIPKDVPHA